MHACSLGKLPAVRFSLKAILFLFLCLIAAQPSRAKPDPSKSEKIQEALSEVVSSEKIPGMVAAIVNAEGLIAIAAAGVRKTGSRAPLKNNDLMHIGSCTKAMTATLLARFVDEGVITWESTLIEIFPEYRNKIYPDYHQITLWQLLTHRSGLPANAKDWWVHRRMELKARRQTIMLENLKEAPSGKSGEFLYSNLGYMIAGCMAEKLSKKSWESLMKTFLFKPLAMKSASFGPPGKPGKIDQPWGHVKEVGQWQAKQFDNAEALGPAGRVHCTLEDWAKFIALQLPGDKPSILNREKLDQLIQPTGNYAAGWNVVQRPWAKGIALSHNGSNTMWHAVVWVAPGLNRAFIVATNSNDDKSPAICDKMIGRLIEIDKTQ